MYKAGALQASQSIEGRDAVTVFTDNLVRRPVALLIGLDQQAEHGPVIAGLGLGKGVVVFASWGRDSSESQGAA
jgi:hypothetical protein